MSYQPCGCSTVGWDVSFLNNTHAAANLYVSNLLYVAFYLRLLKRKPFDLFEVLFLIRQLLSEARAGV